MRFVYLHGFASGPLSRKAQAFRSALGQLGVEVETPDLAAGDFAHLTVSGQLKVVENLLRGEPCRLVGSSMGGYLAALYAADHPEVDRLVLLAPAFGFSSRWHRLIGEDGLRVWRDTGWLEVFHYGDKAQRRVHWGLHEDALLYPASPCVSQPALIFHGIRDEVVPVGSSREFVVGSPMASLTELDSDHELLDALETIVARAVPFLTSG